MDWMHFAHHLSQLKPMTSEPGEYRQWKYMVTRVGDYFAENVPGFDRSLYNRMAECHPVTLSDACIQYLFNEYDTKIRGVYIEQNTCRFKITDYDRQKFAELRDIEIVYLFWDGRDENRRPLRLDADVPL